MIALLTVAVIQAGGMAGEESFAVTRHHITLEGRRLDYTARAGRLPIRDNETGDVHAWVFFVSYTLDSADPRAGHGPAPTPSPRAGHGPAPTPHRAGHGPAPTPRRPLTFTWNGGPGSNAALIQLRGIGPRRFTDAGALVDNDGTWLDRTDLVFVDPVGTGYSRVTRSEYGPEFYQTRGDAESVAEFIRVFRTRFERWQSPLFLAGESFGVTRAAGVAEVLARRSIPLDGVVLIGLRLPLAQVPEPVERALHVPTWTATAWHHQRIEPALQKDFARAIQQSAAWAESTLAPALVNSMNPETEARLVADLARFTGVAPAQLDSAPFELSYHRFARSLLADQGRRLGHYDSRVTGPLETGPGPYDPTADPSLKGSFPPDGVVRYLREEVGYQNDLFYAGPFGGAYPAATTFRGDWMSVRWTWTKSEVPDSGPPPPPDLPLTRAMKANPGLRVFVTCGYYDLVCDVAANDWVVRQLDADVRRRVTVRAYHGGHAVYLDDDARRQLRKDVLGFLTKP